MTATHVNGVAVVTDEPAESPLPTRNGHPVLHKQIRHLLLEDGSEAYGCLHCDYTSDRSAAVRPHLKVHAVPKEQPAGLGVSELMDLARRLQAVERIQADRDEWRDRALKAEGELRKLRKLRKALEPLLPAVPR